MTTSILLALAALAFLMLEIFFVSFGAITLVALVCAGGCVMTAFGVSTTFGWTMVGALVAGGPAVVWGAFKVLPKLPFGRKIILQAPEPDEIAPSDAGRLRRDLLGAVGETTSPLRPAGTAVFGGRPVSVVAKGVMLERGQKVRVVDVSGNRIVVDAVE